MTIENADYVVDSIEKQINALVEYPLRGAQFIKVLVADNALVGNGNSL
jgi:hypothetical protein